MSTVGRIVGSLLVVGAGWAAAQEGTGPGLPPVALPADGPAAPAPDAPVTQEQVDALKQAIEALSQQVQALERQLEQNQAAAAETAAAVAEAAEKAKTAPVVSAGRDGFSLSSPDKAFQLRIGGTFGYDVSWFRQDDALKYGVGDEQDGTGFNFARLRFSGTVYDNVEYMMEYDFATQTGADGPEFKDVYLQLNGIPYGGGRDMGFRAGHFREPFSLEELTSTRYRTFMERSLGNALVPGRNPGIQLSDALLGEDRRERLTWALGVFKEADNWPSSNDADEDQGYIVTGRVTGLPYYADEGRQLIHLGAAYSRRNPDGAVLNWAARPENRLSQVRYVNVEGFAPFRLSDARADDVDLYGLELAGVYGPWHGQAEYTLAEVDTTFDRDRSFDAYYAQMGYFLTGETRPYRHGSGVFDRVRPLRDFGWKPGSGWGAWEITGRYSTIDLNDGGVRGGEQDNITLGLNWYLNPNTRIMWNYIHGDVDHDRYGGSFDSLQMRFQTEF